MQPDAFYKLALAELDAVHRLAYHLCRDRHQADDLVQETYLRALRGSDTFRESELGVRPWLFKILHNTLYTRRAKDRRARKELQRRAEQSMEVNAGEAGSPIDAADGGVAGIRWDCIDDRLCKAIHSLPVAHRTVFLLSSVEDLKYREIADVVGVPVGTVMSRLSRARAALVAQLDDLAAEQNLRRPSPRKVDAPVPTEPKT